MRKRPINASVKDSLNTGPVAPDKFAVADRALAEVSVVAQERIPEPILSDMAEVNAAFVPGTRVTRKRPKGESVIIRETFSLPPGESAQIDTARQRSAMTGLMVNRSEIIRAGIAALQVLDDATFLRIVSAVPKLKTGRPAG